jgi:hypothetical protein
MVVHTAAAFIERLKFGFIVILAFISIYTKHISVCLILWHVDALLGNDRERSSYTTAITE